MALQGTTTGPSIRSELALVAAAARALGQRLRTALKERAQAMLVEPYRPELHYMRGPGPRWHEKHRMATARMADR
jgi:hypothetical protein